MKFVASLQLVYSDRMDTTSEKKENAGKKINLDDTEI